MPKNRYCVHVNPIKVFKQPEKHFPSQEAATYLKIDKYNHIFFAQRWNGFPPEGKSSSKLDIRIYSFLSALNFMVRSPDSAATSPRIELGSGIGQ